MEAITKPRGAAIPSALANFDQLPGAARVRLPVVAGLFGISSPSVWRWVKSGKIPQPHRMGGTTAWMVHDLRAALANTSGSNLQSK